jgi:hypothetical protein
MALSKKFQIEVVKDRTLTATVYAPVKDQSGKHLGMKSEKTSRLVPESFMVYFPGGHSVWFETRAKMAAAGILENANDEIDLETGEPTKAPDYVDLKSLVNKRTQAPNALRSL